MFRERDLPVTIGDGAFRLTRVLGKGGMATVFAAEVDLDRFDYALVVAGREAARGESRDEQMARRTRRYAKWSKRERDELAAICRKHDCPVPDRGTAAVKVLLPHLRTRTHLVMRFDAEWRSLLAIGDPNVVAVYGGGVDPEYECRYYAMEQINGLLSDKEVAALPLDDRLEILCQAAAGLQALHHRGIIHRDVKPANMLTYKDEDGALHVKVGDLGIAKDATTDQELTNANAVFGTVGFIAPELVKGSRLATPATDVYALGASLYQLVKGSRPYQGIPELEVLGMLFRREPPEPLAMRDGEPLPAPLREAVARLMAYEIDDRPPDMPATIELLQRCREQLRTLPPELLYAPPDGDEPVGMATPVMAEDDVDTKAITAEVDPERLAQLRARAQASRSPAARPMAAVRQLEWATLTAIGLVAVSALVLLVALVLRLSDSDGARWQRVLALLQRDDVAVDQQVAALQGYIDQASDGDRLERARRRLEVFLRGREQLRSLEEAVPRLVNQGRGGQARLMVQSALRDLRAEPAFVSRLQRLEATIP